MNKINKKKGGKEVRRGRERKRREKEREKEKEEEGKDY